SIVWLAPLRTMGFETMEPRRGMVAIRRAITPRARNCEERWKAATRHHRGISLVATVANAAPVAPTRRSALSPRSTHISKRWLQYAANCGACSSRAACFFLIWGILMRRTDAADLGQPR